MLHPDQKDAGRPGNAVSRGLMGESPTLSAMILQKSSEMLNRLSFKDL